MVKKRPLRPHTWYSLRRQHQCKRRNGKSRPGMEVPVQSQQTHRPARIPGPAAKAKHLQPPQPHQPIRLQTVPKPPHPLIPLPFPSFGGVGVVQSSNSYDLTRLTILRVLRSYGLTRLTVLRVLRVLRSYVSYDLLQLLILNSPIQVIDIPFSTTYLCTEFLINNPLRREHKIE